MRTIKGPGLFLAQFAGDEAPFNSWDSITKWAASLGYAGVQVPSNDSRLFDLDLAVTSQDWRDEFVGTARQNGVERILKEHVPGVTRVEQVNASGEAEDLYDEYAPF